MAFILRRAHEEAPEVDCKIGHVTRQEASFTVTALHWTLGKAKEGAPEDHLAVDDGVGNRQHSSHGKAVEDVEGLRFLPQT